jgi:hypothetical protein
MENLDTDLNKHDENFSCIWTVSGDCSPNRICKRRLDETLLPHGSMRYLSVQWGL